MDCYGIDAMGARLVVMDLMLWIGWQRTNGLARGEGRWPIGRSNLVNCR